MDEYSGPHAPAPMPMDRVRLREALRAQRGYCESRSPLYAKVLKELEDDAAEEPPWLERLESTWTGRSFPVGWEAAHLLLAGLHFWALKGAAPELAEIYPSCGGTGGEPDGRARAFMRRAPGEFWERLAAGLVQTNEVGRSVAWMLAAAAAFGVRSMPFHLLELGASAGLNLVGDHLSHSCSFLAEDGKPCAVPAGWDRRPHPVLSRTGLDLHPRRLADPEDQLWLKACVWADDLPRLRRLEQAIAIFRQLEASASAPMLERCAFAEAPAWLAANRRPRPAQGLLVFNAIATVYLDDGEYAALRRGMAKALEPWDARALWVEYERPRGTEGPMQLTVHRVLDGMLESRILAYGAPRPSEIRMRPGWDFAAR
jgi:hypothetical protein